MEDIDEVKSRVAAIAQKYSHPVQIYNEYLKIHNSEVPYIEYGYDSFEDLLRAATADFINEEEDTGEEFSAGTYEIQIDEPTTYEVEEGYKSSLDEFKERVLAILLTITNQQDLCDEYRSMYCEELPYMEYGFASLDDLVENLTFGWTREEIVEEELEIDEDDYDGRMHETVVEIIEERPLLLSDFSPVKEVNEEVQESQESDETDTSEKKDDYNSNLEPGASLHIFGCPVEQCPSWFRMDSRLAEHLETAHNGAKFTCLVCCEDFSTSSTDYVAHILKYAMEKTCCTCGEKTTSTRQLLLHWRRKHHNNGGRIYACGMCRKEYVEERACEAHERMHEMFRCGECAQSFMRRIQLKEHEKTHQRGRPLAIVRQNTSGSVYSTVRKRIRYY